MWRSKKRANDGRNDYECDVFGDANSTDDADFVAENHSGMDSDSDSAETDSDSDSDNDIYYKDDDARNE